MYKESLYFRIVTTFIGVVLLSLFVSYVVTSIFFQKDVLFEEEIANITAGIANIVDMTEEEELPELIERLKEFHFEIQFVNDQGIYSTKSDPFVVPEKVLNEVRSSPGNTPIIYFEKAARLGGIPVKIGNEEYTLFVRINYEEEGRSISRVILISLFIVLLVGSTSILLASQYVVNPIKKLTNAVKEIAVGNFSIRLNSKINKGEIGELINGFNHMASEIEQIDKMRSDFVSSVSHEIQSPLTSIKGFTKAIRDDVVPIENQKEYLDIIYQETDRLSRLSENLLRLATLESEHHPFEPSKYRVDEQLRKVVLETEPLWMQRGLRIHLELQQAEIFADEDLFKQVWLNLLTNAIKYSPDNGVITVSSRSSEDTLKVKVTDQGKGIPAEAIPYLFDKFYKVDKARSNNVEGNGLGLSIVKRILSIHQCKINVKSEKGVGTTFEVIIPMEKERES